LFEKITQLPEYYLTRIELDIMRSNAKEIAQRVGPHASLIEFGSGSSLKIRILLKTLDRLAAYVPVDISRDHLLAAAKGLKKDFPWLNILPVAADFTQPFPLPDPQPTPLRNLIYFPGSTIGNFDREAARDLLRVMHYEAGDGGALLIGVDLKKDKDVLERAYNDGAGVTAAFNLNLLKRLNKEFAANFNLDKFEHAAVYLPEQGCIEMRLVSLGQQEVTVAGKTFAFSAGEYIVTEHSNKYTLQEFSVLANSAGFEVEKIWCDPAELFSVQFCVRR
jgi:dimethylhistidine N-methyltransferase